MAGFFLFSLDWTFRVAFETVWKAMWTWATLGVNIRSPVDKFDANQPSLLYGHNLLDGFEATVKLHFVSNSSRPVFLYSCRASLAPWLNRSEHLDRGQLNPQRQLPSAGLHQRRT